MPWKIDKQLQQLASHLRVGWEGMGWDREELSVKGLPRSRAPLLCTANVVRRLIFCTEAASCSSLPYRYRLTPSELAGHRAGAALRAAGTSHLCATGRLWGSRAESRLAS